MQKWKQCERPEITPENAEKRLRWAETYAGYTAEDFFRVIWSDECSVERGAGIRRIYTFRSPKQQIIERDVHTVRCGKGVKQMFWAAFGFNPRTGLLPLDGVQKLLVEELLDGLSVMFMNHFYQMSYSLGISSCMMELLYIVHT
jgi:hypothetical protein